MSEAQDLLQKGLALWETDRRGAEKAFVRVYWEFDDTREAELAQAYLYKLRQHQPRPNPARTVPNHDQQGASSIDHRPQSAEIAEQLSNVIASDVKKLLHASRITFYVSLMLPAYMTGSTYHFGIEALIMGPIGLFGGHFSWLANPILWWVWKAIRSSKFETSPFMSILAFAIAMTFLFSEEIPVGSAGMYNYSTHVGYYLWLTSIGLAFASSFTGWRRISKVVPE